MTGINNQQGVHGFNLNDFQVIGAGEPDAGRLSAPGQPAAEGALGEAGADLEVAQDRERNQNQTPSIPMFEKCSLIDRRLASANLNPAQQISLQELYEFASDFVQTRDGIPGGKRFVFSSVDDARILDNFVNRKTKEMAGRLCFRQDNEQNAALKADFERLLDRIMTADYQAAAAEDIKEELSNLADRIKNSVGGDDELARKARSLLDEVKTRYCRIVDNQVQLRHLLGAQKNGEKITFSSPTDAIGIGHLLPSEEDSLESLVSRSGIDNESIAGEIEGGGKNYDRLLADHPEYKSALNEYSSGVLEECRRTLDEVANDIGELGNRAVALRTERQNGQVGQNVQTNDVSFFRSAIESLRTLKDISSRAASQLSADDRQTLLGSGQQPGRISIMIDSLLDRIAESYPQNLPGLNEKISFLKNNHAVLNGLLEAAGYSETAFSRMVGDQAFLPLMSVLSDAAASPGKLRGALGTLSSYFASGDAEAGGMGMLKAVVSSLSLEGRTDAQKAVLEHMTASLEITADASACIGYILYGDAASGANQIFSIEELKEAYHRLCNPDAGLKAFLKKHDGGLSLQTAEQMVLRAAYHLFIAEHPDDEQCRLEFRENQRFKTFMGIVGDAQQNQPKTVNENRYDGFDPITVNLENTKMSAFLFNFNLLMSKTGLMQGVEKIPTVHLTKRLSEAVGVDIEALLDSKPELRDSYQQLELQRQQPDGARKLLAWFQEHQADLAAGLRQTKLHDFQTISAESQRLAHENDRLLKRELLPLKNFMETGSKLGAPAASQITPDEALRIAQKSEGSIGLATLISTLGMLKSGFGVHLPSGGYKGLGAADFTNVARIDNIRAVLSAVPDEERKDPDFKFAFLAYARLKSAHANAVRDANQIRNYELNPAAVTAALQDINLPDVPANELALPGPSLREQLSDFCLMSGRIAARDLEATLSNISLSKNLFKAAGNVFIPDDKTGKEIMKEITGAIGNAVKALKRPGADPNAIMTDLLEKVTAKIGGNEAVRRADSIVAMSSFSRQTGNARNTDEALDQGLRSIFKDRKSFRGTLSTLSRNFSCLHFERAKATGEALSSFVASNRGTDEEIGRIYGVPYTQYALNKAIRLVAYNSGFKTRADMTYAIGAGNGRGGKSRDDLVRECVSALREQLDCSRDVAERLVQRHLKTDVYMNFESGTTIGQKIRRVFRKFAHSKVGSLVGRFGAFLVNRHHTSASIAERNADIDRKEAARQQRQAVAESVLLSMDSGTNLIYTKENKFKVSVGLKQGTGEVLGNALGISAGIGLSAETDFQISRDGQKFTYVMSAAIGAELEASADLGFVKASASVDGKYQPVYVVQFDGLDKATKFLSKVLEASVKLSDLRESSNIERQSRWTVGADASVKVDVVRAVDGAGLVSGDGKQSSLKADISAGAGISRTKTQAWGSNTRSFSTHKVGYARAGFSATFDAHQLMLNNNKLLGDKPLNKLTEDEKKEKDQKEAELKKLDSMINVLTNHTRAFKGWVSKPTISQFWDRKYGVAENAAWSKMDDFQKYEHDKGRFFSEAIASAIEQNVVNGAIKDADGLLDYVASKIPVVNHSKEFYDELKKGLTQTAGNMISVFNGSNLRVGGKFSLGSDTSDLATVSADVSYRFDETRRYDTNLLNNDLRSVEMKHVVQPETSGSDDNIKQHNMKFMSASLKKLGFSKEQIGKVMRAMKHLQAESTIASMEIIMNGRKESLLNIMRKVQEERDRGGRSAGDVISKGVESMKNEDFAPAKVVFTTTKKLSSNSLSLGGGTFVNVGLSVNESVSKNTTYEVAF